MKLPKLAIEGSHSDIRQFVAAQASKSGFQLTNCLSADAHNVSQGESTLLIWVTAQAAPPKAIATAERQVYVQHDLRNLYANVMFFCSENLGERLLQVDRFLAEIKSGAIHAASTGQLWRGYTMPQTNYEIVLPAWRERILA